MVKNFKRDHYHAERARYLPDGQPSFRYLFPRRNRDMVTIIRDRFLDMMDGK